MEFTTKAANSCETSLQDALNLGDAVGQLRRQIHGEQVKRQANGGEAAGYVVM